MEATQQVVAEQSQNTDPASGSDQDGLLWGFHFVPNQPARSITSEEAVNFLTAPGPVVPDEFLWLHFSLSNEASEPWLRRYLTLPDTFYESLHSDLDYTHLEQDADSLVARIHDVLLDFTFAAPAVATTSLCIKRRVLVSARRRPLRSVDQLRAAVEAGQVFRSPNELLSHLLREQASALVEIVRKFKKRVDPMEDQLLAKRISVSRKELGSLRRMLVRLQRLLAPEPAAFFRLVNQPPEWITQEELQNLQQAAEKFSTAISDTAALVEQGQTASGRTRRHRQRTDQSHAVCVNIGNCVGLADQSRGGLVWHECRWYSSGSTPVRFLFGRDSPVGLDSVSGVLGIGQAP